MSSYKEHIIIGSILTVIAILLYWYGEWKNYMPGLEFNFITYGIIALIVIVYSQLPDVDADTSIINKYVNTGLGMAILVGILFKYYAMVSICAGIFIVLEWVKHRGIFHSIIAGLFLSIALVLIHPLFAIITMINFMSHLILDNNVEWF